MEYLISIVKLVKYMLSELELADIILKNFTLRILKDGSIDVLLYVPGTTVWVDSVKATYVYVEGENGFIQMAGP